jgi:hypothetical protein
MMGGPAPVSVAEVIERDVQQWQEFAGRIIPVDSAEIRPQVSGLIDKIHFKTYIVNIISLICFYYRCSSTPNL